jgi:hypothetical protein
MLYSPATLCLTAQNSRIAALPSFAGDFRLLSSIAIRWQRDNSGGNFGGNFGPRK